MKALAIRQPWAWAILHAGKDIENRDWSTTFRGTVLIHASAGMTRSEYDDGMDSIKYAVHPDSALSQFPRFEDLQRGGIVGQVDIVDCIRDSDSNWFFGEYGFVLRNAKPLPFRSFKGMLGFFDVPDLSLQPST